MSVGRVSMVEFKNEEAINQFSKDYAKEYYANFPTAEASIAVQTGPTSSLGVTIYPNEEAVDGSLSARKKFFKEREHLIQMDQSFFYEGKVNFKFLSPTHDFIKPAEQYKEQVSQLDAIQKENAELKAMISEILARLPS